MTLIFNVLPVNPSCKARHRIICAPGTPCDVCRTWSKDQWSAYHSIHTVLDARREHEKAEWLAKIGKLSSFSGILGNPYV